METGKHAKLEALRGEIPPGVLDMLRIPGVGPKTCLNLKRIGVVTIGDLRQTPVAKLRPVFGRYAERMRERAAGIDHRPVISCSDDKSISTEETFDTDLADAEQMIRCVREQAEKVAGRIRKKSLSAGVVRVKIRTADFRTQTRQRALQPASHDTRVLGEVAQSLLETWLQANPDARVRLLGVGAGQLAEVQQLGLFDEASAGAAVDETVDGIRERFGADSLKRGSRLR